MQPSAPTSAATPAPPDPMQALASQLDDVMAQAEIAANAQRDIETEEGNPPASPGRQEAPPAEGEADDSDEGEGAEPGEEPQDGTDDEEEDTEPEPAQAPTAEQPKYSRRDAARFAGELEQAKQALEQTRSQLEAHKGELGHFKASDQAIRRHLQTQSGYVQEQNGRFRYENLSEKVLKGSATPEEAEEVAQMTQWHEFAAPIFRAAEELVLGSFKADWTTLKDLDGVGDEGLKTLNAASKPTDAVRAVHTLAFAAGEAKAKAQSQATIARLKAEVKSLKTGQVARQPQPATPNGAAVPAKGGFLSRAIDPVTGLPNPDFDREVAQGKWLGADLAQT